MNWDMDLVQEVRSLRTELKVDYGLTDAEMQDIKKMLVDRFIADGFRELAVTIHPNDVGIFIGPDDKRFVLRLVVRWLPRRRARIIGGPLDGTEYPLPELFQPFTVPVSIEQVSLIGEGTKLLVDQVTLTPSGWWESGRCILYRWPRQF